MKKRSSLLILGSLALMLVMNNCQRVTDPLPTGPNADLLKGFTDINMKAVVPAQPEAVVTTPSSLTPSTKILDFQAGLKNAGSQISAPVQRAIDDLSAALPAQDIALLAEMSPALVNTLAEGGTLPANVQSIIDRATSHPVLSTYFPKLVLSTVKEIPFPTVVPERDVDTETASADKTNANSCEKQAKAAYQAKVKDLKADRKTALAVAAAQNKSAVATINAQAIQCKSDVSSDYNTQREALRAQAAQDIAAINANPNNSLIQKRVMIALVNLTLSRGLASLNTMEGSDKRACDAAKSAALASEAAAYENEKEQIEANYDIAVEQAKAAQADFIANCEYQQGLGN